MLAEGIEQEVAPALAGLDDALGAVTRAQASVLLRISETMDGRMQWRGMRGLRVVVARWALITAHGWSLVGAADVDLLAGAGVRLLSYHPSCIADWLRSPPRY